jgi:hypothetical protein
LVYLLPIFTDKKGNATTSDSLPATPAVSTLQPDGKLNFVTDTYVIVTGSFKQMENVQAEIQSLRGRGEQAGYFWRPDFPALEGWALYSTFVGLYDSYAACESKLRDLKRFNANYYGLKLSRDSKKVMIH